ncbi:uncharacterized protein TRIADDRAFT_61101 [Trichoplax adhaerens]|uniref:Uncharacterized protein n=1 Tax=Trichoplax adhaerens TaxID=10228 RepID=B3SA17_TRIAD|nr:predicted protein [Trichoplax adhaerens]EDV20434.1 predicted protein [Trichoplax adhaerens]|eukprot:XP_002117128.1 predicted protein [Trichoplax adhaerens]
MLDSLDLILIAEFHKSTPFIFNSIIAGQCSSRRNYLSTDVIIARLDVQYCGTLRDSLSQFIRFREEKYHQICRCNNDESLHSMHRFSNIFEDVNSISDHSLPGKNIYRAEKHQQSKQKLFKDKDVDAKSDRYSSDLIFNSQNTQIDFIQEKRVVNLGIVQQGLPHWIIYIPIALYSKRFRQFLQFIVVLYTLFSVVWATWQLYKNVSFIKVSLQPLVIAMGHYFDYFISFVDQTLLRFTHYWLKCFKPVCILFTSAFPWISIYDFIEQLLFTILIDEETTDALSNLWRLLKYLLNLGIHSFRGIVFVLEALRVKKLLGLLFDIIANIRNNINSTSIPVLTVKEQLALIRSLTVNHIRSLYFGIFTIVRAHNLIVFCVMHQ